MLRRGVTRFSHGLKPKMGQNLTSLDKTLYIAVSILSATYRPPAKSCEDLQLIGIANGTFEIQLENETRIDFCSQTGRLILFYYTFAKTKNM